MSRVLILGGMGMLGHRLAACLHTGHEVSVTVREGVGELPGTYPEVDVIGGFDLRDTNRLGRLIEPDRWDVIVNAAGLIRQRPASRDTVVEAIAINSLLPQALGSLCVDAGTRLIHISTDCVFSGNESSQRGPDGYRPEDPPDARDTYGLSKLLGEVRLPGCLCLRVSMIGRELRGYYGLLEWYLREAEESVRGYRRALFTGFTTPVAARLVDSMIREFPALDGLWHVAADPISKFDLLTLVRERLGQGPVVLPDDRVYCDRRLDGSAFRERTGWRAPSWNEMIDELAGVEQSCGC